MSTPPIGDGPPKRPQTPSQRRRKVDAPPTVRKTREQGGLLKAGPLAKVGGVRRSSSPNMEGFEATTLSDSDFTSLDLHLKEEEGVEGLQQALTSLSALTEAHVPGAVNVLQAKMRLLSACSTFCEKRTQDYSPLANRVRQVKMKLEQELPPGLRLVISDDRLFPCFVRHRRADDLQEAADVVSALNELQGGSPPPLSEWMASHAREPRVLAAYALSCPAALENDEKKELASLLHSTLSEGGRIQVLRLILENSVLSEGFLKAVAGNRQNGAADLNQIPFLRETTVATLFVTLPVTKLLEKWGTGFVKSLDKALSKAKLLPARDISYDPAANEEFGNIIIHGLVDALATMPKEVGNALSTLAEMLSASLGLSPEASRLWVLDTVFLRGVNPQCTGMDKARSDLSHRILATKFFTAFVAEAFGTDETPEGKQEAENRVAFCRMFRRSPQANFIYRAFFPEN